MNSNSNQQSAYSTALLRSLHYQGVQFLRFVTVDVCNNIRCKVRPISHLLKQKSSTLTLDDQVSVAAICYAGLPYYTGYMIEGTGMSARDVLILQPDLNSFRILPYAPKTAMVMADLQDQYTNETSPLCTRSLLRKVIQTAMEEFNIGFVSGTLIFSTLSRKRNYWSNQKFSRFDVLFSYLFTPIRHRTSE
jgi:glutamine synthetase